MQPVDLAEKLYNHELQLKNEISVSLAVPIAALTFMTAAIGVYFVSFNFDISASLLKSLDTNAVSHWYYLIVDIIFSIASVALVVFLVLSTKFLFQALPEEDYKFVEFSEAFSSVIENMKTSNFSSDSEEDYSILNKQFTAKLFSCTQINSKINRERNTLRSKCVRNLRWGLYCFAASTALFFSDKIMSEKFIFDQILDYFR